MITALYAALAAFMLQYLSVRVIKARHQAGLAMGDGHNFDLTRRIRAQGNFTEYTPLFLIMLGLAEHGGLPLAALHAFGIVFFLGRISHAYSLLKHERYEGEKLQHLPVYRMGGMIATFTLLGALGIVLLLQFAYGQSL